MRGDTAIRVGLGLRERGDSGGRGENDAGDAIVGSSLPNNFASRLCFTPSRALRQPAAERMAVLLPHAALAQHHLEIPAGDPVRILHISDTHQHPLQSGCRDAIAPCTPKNTTDFLAAAVAAEKPSLIVFTGDISDEFIGSDWTGREWVHRRSIEPEVALASIYDTGKNNNIPFVASLGNHDGALPHYSRAQVMRYIAADPRSLVTENEIDGSVGNYYLDLVHRGEPVVVEVEVLARPVQVLGSGGRGPETQRQQR